MEDPDPQHVRWALLVVCSVEPKFSLWFCSGSQEGRGLCSNLEDRVQVFVEWNLLIEDLKSSVVQSQLGSHVRVSLCFPNHIFVFENLTKSVGFFSQKTLPNYFAIIIIFFKLTNLIACDHALLILSFCRIHSLFLLF